MNKFLRKYRDRFATTFAIIIVATLVACGGGGGGGGGGSPTPAPTPTPIPTARLSSITPSPGATDVPVDAKVVINLNITDATLCDASRLSFLCNNKATGFYATSVLTSTSCVNTITPAALTNGDNCAIAGDITTTGDGGSVKTPINASFTVAPTTVLHYTDKVYALWTGAYPFAVTKTGVAKVTNKTQYTSGFYPLSNCWLMDSSFLSQTGGRILTNCQDAIGGGRHSLYIDPTKDELYEYTGTVPTNIVWHAVTPVSLVLHQAGWGSQAQVSGGWYYTIGTSNWVLWFLDDKTGISAIVKQGNLQADENIDYLSTYTN